MKLFAPKYYKEFKCTADKCDHSCCIGWEIDIDDKSLTKYQLLENPYAENIRQSISYDEAPHFKLCEGDRCAHLDENGLCKIILNAGEDFLCDICREHPRFYNYTDVAEVGLGMSCREAARLILTSSSYSEMVMVGEISATDSNVYYNGRIQRDNVYAILQDKTLNYQARVNRICSKYKIHPLSDDEILNRIESLEYLDETHREMFKCYSSKHHPDGCDEYLEPALAYFIYRHCTEAYDETDFSNRLAFCIVCERLLASLIYSQNAHDLIEIATLASIVSEEIEYSEDNVESLMT